MERKKSAKADVLSPVEPLASRATRRFLLFELLEFDVWIFWSVITDGIAARVVGDG